MRQLTHSLTHSPHSSSSHNLHLHLKPPLTPSSLTPCSISSFLHSSLTPHLSLCLSLFLSISLYLFSASLSLSISLYLSLSLYISISISPTVFSKQSGLLWDIHFDCVFTVVWLSQSGSAVAGENFGGAHVDCVSPHPKCGVLVPHILSVGFLCLLRTASSHSLTPLSLSLSLSISLYLFSTSLSLSLSLSLYISSSPSPPPLSLSLSSILS